MRRPTWSYGDWKARLEMLVGHKIEDPLGLEYIGPLYGTGIEPHNAWDWWQNRKKSKESK